MTDEAYLPPEECHVGYVYRVHARNFGIAICIGGDACGFMGVREKFGREFLFTEYHWDKDSNFGTVKPLEEMFYGSKAPFMERELTMDNEYLLHYMQTVERLW